MAIHEGISVTTIDDFSPVAHVRNETRKLNEYRATNTPLSAAEIALDEAMDTRHLGWAARTLKNIRDLTPLMEQPR